MIRFKLGAEDRAKLNCPEVIEYDETRLLLSEARKVQQATGFHPGDLADELKKSNVDAIAALLWLGMLRAGMEVDFDTLDFDLAAIEDVPPDEPGKDQA